MSTLQFKRSPRLSAPRQPGGEVHLEPPPEVPRVIPGNIVMKLLPAVMIVASVGMMAFMFVVGGRNPSSLLFGGMFLMSTVGMMAGGMGGRGGGQKKAEMNEDRKDYLRYLGQMRDRAREAALDQRASLEWTHPDPQALWSIANALVFSGARDLVRDVMVAGRWMVQEKHHARADEASAAYKRTLKQLLA